MPKLKLELVPLILLLLYIFKSILISAQLSDALIISALVCLTAFYEYQVKNKKLTAQNAEIEALKVRMTETESDLSLVRGKLSIQTLGNSLNKQKRSINE